MSAGAIESQNLGDLNNKSSGDGGVPAAANPIPQEPNTPNSVAALNQQQYTQIKIQTQLNFRRLSQRVLGKRKEGGNNDAERPLANALQGQKGSFGPRSQKIELTDAERDLLSSLGLGGDPAPAKAKGNDSEHSGQGSPTNGGTVKRRSRGEDGIETGGRVRKPKNNFLDDFVYDDYIVKNSINQKQAKDASTGHHSNQLAGVQKVKKAIAKKTVKPATDKVQSTTFIQQTLPEDEPIKLYCICRTADESAQMIGCDKCDEWYHFDCVGIDISQIPDIENYDFVCPECQKKTNNKNSAGKKTLQSNSNLNKRQAKAQSKKAQALESYESIQTGGQGNIRIPQSSARQQLQNASVQQKRKFQKNRQQIQHDSPVQLQKGVVKKQLGVKRPSNGNNASSGRMVLNTNLGSGRLGPSDYNNDKQGGNSYYEEDEQFNEMEEDGNDDQNEYMSKQYFESQQEIQNKQFDNRLILAQRQMAENEAYMKKLTENNVEKVIQKDNYLYFISKNLKDMPLEQQFKLEVPDKRMQIRDEHIPNLKNLLLKNKKDSDDKINGDNNAIEKSSVDFHFNDEKMDKTKAAQYYPPYKRDQFKHHLTKTTIQLTDYKRASNSSNSRLMSKNQGVETSIGRLQQHKLDKIGIINSSAMKKKDHNDQVINKKSFRPEDAFITVKDFYNKKSNSRQHTNSIYSSSQLLGNYYKLRNQKSLMSIANTNQDTAREPVQKESVRYKFHDSQALQRSRSDFAIPVERYNQRNESVLSLKQAYKENKEENNVRKTNLSWSRERNKSITIGTKSYSVYPSVPYPNTQGNNRGQSTVEVARNSLLDLNDMKAQSIINTENKFINMAQNFQQLRNSIKLNKSMKIKNYQQSKIYDLNQKQAKISDNQPQSSQPPKVDIPQQFPYAVTFRKKKKHSLSIKMNKNLSAVKNDQIYTTTFKNSFTEQQNQDSQQIAAQNQEILKKAKKINVKIYSAAPLSQRRETFTDQTHDFKMNTKFDFSKRKLVLRKIDPLYKDTLNVFSDKHKLLQPEMFTSVYNKKYQEGSNSIKDYQQQKLLNRSYKKDLLDNHFDYGNKLTNEQQQESAPQQKNNKQQSYVIDGQQLQEQQELRSKLKAKIEKLNWNIKQATPSKQVEASLNESMNRSTYSMKSSDSAQNVFITRNLSMPKLQLGYQQNSEMNTSRQISQTSRGLAIQDNQRETSQQYVINRFVKSQVSLGSDRHSGPARTRSVYNNQFVWTVPKYEL